MCFLLIIWKNKFVYEEGEDGIEEKGGLSILSISLCKSAEIKRAIQSGHSWCKQVTLTLYIGEAMKVTLSLL